MQIAGRFLLLAISHVEADRKTQRSPVHHHWIGAHLCCGQYAYSTRGILKITLRKRKLLEEGKIAVIVSRKTQASRIGAAACADSVASRCLCRSSRLGPRQSPAQSPATLTVNARLVVLDVVVTGKDGKPVNDLTEKDFQVFGDGKLRRISLARSVRCGTYVAANFAITPSAAAVFRSRTARQLRPLYL